MRHASGVRRVAFGGQPRNPHRRLADDGKHLGWKQVSRLLHFAYIRFLFAHAG
jgi:hypothetical protein